jgi:hypothetical protein
MDIINTPGSAFFFLGHDHSSCKAAVGFFEVLGL